MADDAGALLVRSGLVTADALELARALVQSEGGTIGEHLVATGALSDDTLTEFYRTRLLVPQVNPNTLARLPEHVIAAIPVDMAIDLRVIPVAMADGITIAMGDPSSRVAVDEVGQFVGTYVVRSVATQLQLAWCLAHYYGHVTTLGQRLLQAGAEASAELGADPGAKSGAAFPEATSPPRRSRGVTSKVNAARHRAMAPITAQVNVPRPATSLLEPASAAGAAADAPAAAPVTAPSAPEGDRGRARTITGEIASRNASVEKVAAIADESGPEPTVTIEISPELRPVRRGAHWVDPPELASRSGELVPRPSAQRPVEAEPAVVIAEDVFAISAMSRATTEDDYDSDYADVAIVVGEPAPSDSGTDVAAVVAALDDAESAPILLTSKRPTVDLRRPASAPPRDAEAGVPRAVEGHEPSGVVLLAQPKPSRQLPTAEPPVAAEPGSGDRQSRQRRAEKRTQLGLGIEATKSAPAETAAHARAARDTEVTIPPTMTPTMTSTMTPTMTSPSEPVATEEPAPRATDAALPGQPRLPRAATARDATAPAASPAPANPAPDAKPAADAPSAPAAKPAAAAKPAVAAKPAADAPPSPAAKPVPAAKPAAPAPASARARSPEPEPAAPPEPERPAQRAAARVSSYSDAIDDGWGPPGSTIPPPWLGAIPGGIEANAIPGAIIPISDESGPLLMAAPTPPQAGAWRSSPSIPIANSPADLVAELEAATSRVVELVRRLDQARNRDEIIELLVTHLLDSHARAGFLTVRHKLLTAFRVDSTSGDSKTEGKTAGKANAEASARAEMKLDGPSTLQDVVDTRLPYRGPVADDASRQFLTAAVGDAPGEILLVPISVRDRVVGVLFADRRKRHTFDEQLAVASRAAGVAFERVLLARRER